MNNEEDNIYGVYECADCHKEFTIEKNEAQFYKDKGFDLPKRCAPCRQIRRQNKVEVMERKQR